MRGFTKAPWWGFVEVLNGLLLPSCDPPGGMAHLVRLIAHGAAWVFACWWLLQPLASLAYPASSNAGTPASTNSTVCTVAPCYSYQARNGKPFLNSPLAAAQSTVGDSSIGGCGTIVTATATGVGNTARWSATCTAGSIPSIAMYNVTTRTPDAVSYSCPGGGTLSGTSCLCPEGYDDSGTACVEAVDPAQEYCNEVSSNPAVGVSSPRPAGTSGLDSYTTCYSNQYSLYACSGTMEPEICGTAVDGKTHCTGKVTFTGSVPCTGTTTPEAPTDIPAPLPEAPPPGQCPGEVNGVAVYVPCSNTSSTSTKTNETTDSNGTKQTSETRNTTCNAAGSCTTTVTTTTTVNGGSPSTSTSTTMQDKGDFCSENPGSRECGQQSSFAGACASGFVCQGDAVQCAMAKELHAQWCRDNQVTDESALYNASKGAEGDQTGDLPGNETIPFGPSSYDDSDAIGGAACVTDLTIEHEWLSATLPLSMICGPLLWFKNALLFIGGIAWLLIVFRRR